MAISQLFNAEKSLTGLMTQTVDLVRRSREVKTMKNYLHCYDILEMTDRLNKPWESHPGYVCGDLGAFVDLEITCKEIILKLDPSPGDVRDYVMNVTRFLIFWRQASGNRFLKKIHLSQGKQGL